MLKRLSHRLRDGSWRFVGVVASLPVGICEGDYVLRALLVITLLVCLNCWCPLWAASIGGEVIDEQSGKGLDSTDVEIRLLVSDGGRAWSVAQTTHPFPVRRFAFHNVSPGTYAVEFVPGAFNSYQWELYAGADSAADLTPIQITKAQDEIDLGLIALGPPPFELTELVISPNEGRDYSGLVSTAGGPVEVRGVLVNRSGAARSLVLWATAEEETYVGFYPAGGNTWGTMEIEGSRRRVLARAGETPFRMRFDVPPLPVAHKEYVIAVFAGTSRWEAVDKGSYLFLSVDAPNEAAARADRRADNLVECCP